MLLMVIMWPQCSAIPECPNQVNLFLKKKKKERLIEETERWCEGCWSGTIRSAARGAEPEEETALGVVECENPKPLRAWLRGPVPY